MIKCIFQWLLLISVSSLFAEVKPVIDGKKEALSQIKSKDSEMRRSAILLLGKFDDSPSMVAIVNSLGDSDALVRNSALTAVSEYLMVDPFLIISVLKKVNQSNRNQTISQVFGMIADSDLDNRRLASKLAVTIGNYLGFRPEFLPKAVQSKVLESYTDSDSVVRFNMFGNYTMLKKITPPSILLNGIKDANEQVRKEALEKLVYYERDLAMKNLSLLMDTRDEPSRVFVMQRFYYNSTHKLVADFFATLLNDPNPVVAAYAMFGLIRIKKYPTVKELDRAILGVGVDQQNLARNIINSVGRLPQFQTWLSEKYKNKNHPFYKSILTIYIQKHQQEFTVDQLLLWLNDSDANISRTASYVLNNKKVPFEKLVALTESDYAHTRQSLVNLAFRLNRADQTELLSLLILDDDPYTQVQAMRKYGRLKLEDYLVYAETGLTEVGSQQLLAASIKIFTDNPAVLIKKIKTEPEFKKLFKNAIRVCPRAKVSKQIKTLLLEVQK